MNWLGLLNWYVLQWLGVRLFKYVADSGGPALWYRFRFVRPLSGYGGRPFKTWGGKVAP